ncbi:S-adenosyl-L-methionine-dependent methyltransferase [Saitoella complicata NRRL Y-17804]|uniref:Methyltransferase domain-containing protein n=1 Tax=Saitoella complicata (strain BCRC 22490 / CBS 7301 / JCM 7358 / NBRC 10748 / NRRL Y-17804) TaxID=698492 RepID=A0A0E9NR08_SAICN|nr:S-adenosyl-L-methionine-dependent methyltransferase [Saitoella complicata NRRL Y-17804]ODQ54165.1 S-adenosyl-L-methionine-dependent methyltransferase [Saitoella complicata NRRL Y-17804]GAO52312.1 hypothetical protein G7K_6391-t1 [Saitoella complicata NRRL Y-17804]
MDGIPASTPLSELRDKAYWDSRYDKEFQEKDDANFDWFKGYKDLEPWLSEHLKPESKILMLGCGNSTLSADLYNAGYKHVHNIDFAPTCIERMKALHADKAEMTWEVMDVLDLKYDGATFDVAIDKGTMDALLCFDPEEGSVWSPPEHVVANCTKEVDEAIRVLKPGGKFLYCTFGQPHFRRRYMQREGVWKDDEVKLTTLGDMFHYFLFSCEKN